MLSEKNHFAAICDHSSAQKYLIRALYRPMSYIGRRCTTLKNCQLGVVINTDWISMGDMELNKTGLFHVDTPD